ncbi:MAG: hypothetical protein IKS20_12030 [Victivallales bacterium]|nr:hypothetical protein [Victivallales bacterium]
MKIASFSKKITPECGTLIAGYGPHDVSVAIHDDLYLSGICLDDNGHKALVISYDLLGMDAWYVQEIRQKCAEIIGGQEADVLLTCTHTHGGPSTRSVKSKAPDDKIAHQIIDWTIEAVRNIGPFTECDVYFYSGQCNMNINRRITSNYNVCVQLSGNRDQEAMANGYCDRELGMLLFYKKDTSELLHTILNYAAHPLASHTHGKSGHSITADYPGVLRRMLEDESGAPCTFITGAAGDQFPIDSETGFEALPRMAYMLLKEAIKGLTAFRHPERFKIENPTLKTSIECFEAKPRQDAILPKYYQERGSIPCEVQLLGLGDTICLVGVPGEMLAEVGQEIKWHSPFRKAFILYNSTAYLSYLCHGNALIAGSYEANCQIISQRDTLNLVCCAVDGMHKLLGK